MAIKAVESAHKTFKTYKKTSVAERRRLLLRAADLFEQKREEAKNRHMTETSADEQFAGFNARAMSTFMREVAAGLEAATRGEVINTVTGCVSRVYKEPVGTVLLIMP